MLIAQISDLHVAEDGELMRNFVDSNAKLAEAIAYLNGLERRPDIVLATGDLTDHGRPQQYALLEDILSELECPIYLVPGNHDEREPLREMALRMGLSFVPTEGPIQYVIDDWPVRLVAVDSMREGRHDGQLDDARLAWIDHVLGQEPDRPTLLFLHHPPFETGIWWMDLMGLEGSDRLRDIVARHPQLVRIISGHLHRPIETMWGSTLVSCAPSTAHQTQCNLHPDHSPVIAAEPPAVQLHWWTGDGFVSHTTPFGAPSMAINFAEMMPNWPAVRERMRQGPPFDKGGAIG